MQRPNESCNIITPPVQRTGPWLSCVAAACL